jgi:hypothetical protein
MAEENKNQIAAFDKQLAEAKSAKEAYNSMSGRKDGESKYQLERDALLEIVYQKPELRGAPSWCYFKVINKVMHNNWSLRDGRVYLQAVKRGDDIVDIKVDPSPALRRHMLEAMPNVKEAPEAQVVVRGDIFREDKLNHIILQHEGTKDSAQPDKLDPDITKSHILASYQRIVFKDGSVKDVVVQHSDLLKAKSKSKIKGDGGVWEFPGEASKKTATNRAFNRYHKYPDNSVVFDVSDDADDVDHVDITPEYISEDSSAQSQVDESTGEVTEGTRATADDPKEEKKKKQLNLLD